MMFVVILLNLNSNNKTNDNNDGRICKAQYLAQNFPVKKNSNVKNFNIKIRNQQRHSQESISETI
jgi:hypothetical protein